MSATSSSLSDPLGASTVYASSLRINRLQLAVHLGVESAERVHSQAVEIDLTFYFPQPLPGTLKDGGQYLCYDQISHAIKALCEGREFQLLEYLGTEIYCCVHDMLAQKALTKDIKIGLGVTKCNLPIDFVHGGASYRFSDLPPFSWVPPC
jgi:FolB domain-containing protein